MFFPNELTCLHVRPRDEGGGGEVGAGCLQIRAVYHHDTGKLGGGGGEEKKN